MGAKDDDKIRIIGAYDERKRPSGVHATKMRPDDCQLHIHSNHGPGGHWCAKIFFFSLFVILIGLICLIIMENHGLEDLDRSATESQYAEMLEGWIDEGLDDNDNQKEANQMHDDNEINEEQHRGFMNESGEEIDDQSEEENSIENELNTENDYYLVSVGIENHGTMLAKDNPDTEESSNLKDDPRDHETMEEIEAEDFDEPETDEKLENCSLTVRIIVGLALVIIAHQVLLKKNGTTNYSNVDQEAETIEENEIIGMKRRLTLATAEEPIPLNDNDMKQHPLLIIEDVRVTKDSVETSADEKFPIDPRTSTAEQTKDDIPEKEPLEDDPLSDEFDINKENEFGSEEELMSSEEIDIYSDEEMNDFDSSEISDIDDSDLLKRLDEKYGKLPQHCDTDDIDD